MSNNALVIIDMQNAFINDSNKWLCTAIKDYINKNEQHYKFIIFFRFINYENSNLVRRLNWNKCMQPQSTEVEICESLIKIASRGEVFDKNTYSIFKCADFIDFINKNNINSFDICGLQSDACVLASAFEAFDLDMDFRVLTNLISTNYSHRLYSSNDIINLIKMNLG